MIFLLIYVLVIFIGKDYFSITELGLFFTLIGIIWFLLVLRNFSLKKSLQPIVLIFIGLITIIFKSSLILKSFPLILSTSFFIVFIYSQVTKKYFLIQYIQKFKELDDAEIIYLKKTHIIWIIVTLVNVLLHTYFLFIGTIEEWTFYSTIGWYILLGCGILFQIIFRKFYDKKNAY